MAFASAVSEPIIHQPAPVTVARPRGRVVVEPVLVTRTMRRGGRNWAMLLTFSVVCFGMVAVAAGSLYGLVRAGVWAAGLV